jgi:hypothetical protein
VPPNLSREQGAKQDQQHHLVILCLILQAGPAAVPQHLPTSRRGRQLGRGGLGAASGPAPPPRFTLFKLPGWSCCSPPASPNKSSWTTAWSRRLGDCSRTSTTTSFSFVKFTVNKVLQEQYRIMQDLNQHKSQKINAVTSSNINLDKLESLF